jgi:hypothetical protein
MSDGRILTVGSNASDLDIFITAGQNGIPTDPSGITFRIYDPTNALAVDTVAGNRVDLGRYNASGAIIPNGFVIGDNWQIKWDVVLFGGASGQFVEDFSVALPSLAASFSANTPNNIESMFDRVRLDIGDPDGMIFIDGLLRRTLKKAVSRVNRRLGLVQVTSNSDFIFLIAFISRVSTPVLTLDLQLGTISPDTDPYVDIVILQMEEILLTSELVAFQRLNAHTAGRFGSGIIGTAGDGVSVRNADGVTISKSVQRLTTRADLGKYNLDGIRKQLEEAIKDMRWRLAGGNGKDVAIPQYMRGRGGAYGAFGGGYGPGFF